MGDDKTWTEFERASEETASLEPLKINGNDFVFPAWPNGEQMAELFRMVRENKGQLPGDAMVKYVLSLLEEEAGTLLISLTTTPQQIAIGRDVVREHLTRFGYDITEAPADDAAPEGEEAPLAPNRAARRSQAKQPRGRTSRRRSSSSSKPSSTTSPTTTG